MSTRRRLLHLLAGTGLLAGCSSLGDDKESPTMTTTAPTVTESPPPTTTTRTTTTRTSTTTTRPTTTDNWPAEPTATADTLDAATTPTSMSEVRATLDELDGVARDRVEAGPFEASWPSLAEYSVPDWFRDRKFGIYFHWGLYSVPAYKYEWYPKWMYTPNREGWGSDVHDHHITTYGPPDEYPYQDFASGFTAENFDAEAWAELFATAGAGFAGPVVEHHDGWSNWASGVNPYNAAAMGPERDLVGELETAIRNRGMKFVTTFHHGRAARPDRKLPGDSNYLDSYYGGAYEHYPSVTEGFPNRIMYKNVDEETRWNLWLGKLVEVLERYEPDLVWHDSLHVPPEPVRRRYLAYNLNRAAAQDRDPVITYKEVDTRRVVRSDTLTLDYENTVPDRIQDDPWLSDINAVNGAWCFATQNTYRSVQDLVWTLVEIVAKNGQMLLNVTPKPDGTFPYAIEAGLRELGEWLDVNGEGIYGARPWVTWRDGSRVRYTQSKDGATLYAFTEEFPRRDLRVPSVPTTSTGTVRLLGHGEIDYRVDGGEVVLEVPELGIGEQPTVQAAGFALEGFLG